MPGETTKSIEVSVYGSKEPSSQSFELFARDTAYREWKESDMRLEISQKHEYDDSGYRGYKVNQIFKDSSGFDAIGLTSDEKFFLVLANPINAKINEDNGSKLLSEIANETGGSSSVEYIEGESLVKYLNQRREPFVYAVGTIYDMAKHPILAIRGTAGPKDILSDITVQGVGYDQYASSKNAVNQWLSMVSSPVSGLIFRPHITGHSLGGALSQLIGASYAGNLGRIVTFNSPGISPQPAALLH
jgi:hypothetical protein